MKLVTAGDILQFLLLTLQPKNNQLVLLGNVIITPEFMFPEPPLPVTARQARKWDFYQLASYANDVSSDNSQRSVRGVGDVWANHFCCLFISVVILPSSEGFRGRQRERSHYPQDMHPYITLLQPPASGTHTYTQTEHQQHKCKQHTTGRKHPAVWSEGEEGKQGRAGDYKQFIHPDSQLINLFWQGLCNMSQ